MELIVGNTERYLYKNLYKQIFKFREVMERLMRRALRYALEGKNVDYFVHDHVLLGKIEWIAHSSLNYSEEALERIELKVVEEGDDLMEYLLNIYYGDVSIMPREPEIIFISCLSKLVTSDRYIKEAYMLIKMSESKSNGRRFILGEVSPLSATIESWRP